MSKVIIDTTLTVNGMNLHGTRVPILMKVKVYELNYGPVLKVKILTNVRFTDHMLGGDHPLMYADEFLEEGKRLVAEIVDDTPAVRALINELVSEKRKLYTTTDCTHKARLIKSILTFWS